MGKVIALVTLEALNEAHRIYLSSWGPRSKNLVELRLQQVAHTCLDVKLATLGTDIRRAEDVPPSKRSDLFRWLTQQRRTDEALGPAAAHDATS